MRPVTRTIAVFAFVAAATAPLVALAGPAAAGPFSCAGASENAPDGKFKVGNEAYVGAGQYPNRFRSNDAAVGASLTYTLRWRNVSGITRTIRVQLVDELRDAGYGVRYFVDDVDVSSRVKQRKALVFRDTKADRQTSPLTVVITNRSGAPNSAISLFIAGRYGGAPPTACDLLGPQMNEI
jgi:hypothetical protein